MLQPYVAFEPSDLHMMYQSMLPHCNCRHVNCRRDVQALSMAHCIGKADLPLTVYRLVSKGTLEERVQQLADKKKGSDVIFRSSHRCAQTPQFRPAICSEGYVVCAAAFQGTMCVLVQSMFAQHVTRSR